MNQSSILPTLRQRLGNGLIHTHAGPLMVIIFTFSSDNARPFTFACRSRRRRCEMRMNRTCSDDVDEGDDERESHAHLLTGRRQLTVSAISSRLKQDKRMCLLRQDRRKLENRPSSRYPACFCRPPPLSLT